MNRECSINIFNNCIPYFEVLKDIQRQEILINLMKNKELTVSELVALSELSMPAISHHLKLLSQSGLVVSRKNGNKKYYKLSLDTALFELEKLVESLKNIQNMEKGDM